MSDLRDKLQRHTALIAVACAVLLAGAIALSFYFWPDEAHRRVQYQKMAYFYDLNTKELIEVEAGTPSPMKTDSGPYKGMPAGVRAEVYCCGKYKGEGDYFVGLLEIFTSALPEDQRPKDVDLKIDNHHFLVRRPDEEQWHIVGGPEYKKIMAELRDRCPPDKPLQNVYPVPRPLK